MKLTLCFELYKVKHIRYTPELIGFFQLKIYRVPDDIYWREKVNPSNINTQFEDRIEH